MVADARLLAVSDDEVVSHGAVLKERHRDGALQPLGRERLAVEVQHPFDRLGLPEQFCSGARACLSRTLRSPDALDLRCSLRAPPLSEQPPIDLESNAVRP